jgi:hypothetical protein
LAIVLRPRGGDWLDDEVDRIKRAGVDVLVSMLQADEAAELGLQRRRRFVKQQELSSDHSLFRIEKLRPRLPHSHGLWRT